MDVRLEPKLVDGSDSNLKLQQKWSLMCRFQINYSEVLGVYKNICKTTRYSQVQDLQQNVEMRAVQTLFFKLNKGAFIGDLWYCSEAWIPDNLPEGEDIYRIGEEDDDDEQDANDNDLEDDNNNGEDLKQDYENWEQEENENA